MVLAGGQAAYVFILAARSMWCLADDDTTV